MMTTLGRTGKLRTAATDRAERHAPRAKGRRLKEKGGANNPTAKALRGEFDEE